jgi:formylglycine-generating enzyme required for sulfatase activity
MKHISPPSRAVALLGLAFVTLSVPSHANNITVSAPQLVNNNSIEGYVNVRFNLSWENSWRTSSPPSNWDAAWIFIKYKDASGVWHHACLGSETDHVPGIGTSASLVNGLLTPGAPYDAANNWGVGVFVYRSGDGSGAFSSDGVELRWNYSQNSITYGEITTVKVCAIEMVWIPEGAFYVGSGGTETVHFKDGNTNNPFLVSSEDALNMSSTIGHLWATSAIETATLPLAFPKGYSGFYMMKDLVSQGQYVDFLNCLTRVQQNNRTAADLSAGITYVAHRYVMADSVNSSIRQFICCDSVIDGYSPITFYCDANGNGIGNEDDDGQWVACNFLSWSDQAAYLDWCGLRPMTELEYEKAGRGTAMPVPNEFAWGTTSSTPIWGNLSNAGMIDETGPGNVVSFDYDLYNVGNTSVWGPARVGITATPGNTRTESGAGYYGVLDLTGNLGNRVISVSIAPGRAFTGVLGNGTLSPGGNADVENWPTVEGFCYRGGDYDVYMGDLEPLSDRIYADLSPPYYLHDLWTGARGVR